MMSQLNHAEINRIRETKAPEIIHFIDSVSKHKHVISICIIVLWTNTFVTIYSLLYGNKLKYHSLRNKCQLVITSKPIYN